MNYARRDELLVELGFASYDAYLASPRWLQLSKDAREGAESRCQLCNGTTGGINVHHRTYNRLGTEFEYRDLTVLCRRHHEMVHGITYNGSKKKATQGAKSVVQSKRGQKAERAAQLLSLFQRLVVGTYSNQELRTKLGWPSNHTTSALSILRKQGHITQVRVGKQVRWQLITNTETTLKSSRPKSKTQKKASQKLAVLAEENERLHARQKHTQHLREEAKKAREEGRQQFVPCHRTAKGQD